jgi:hypothetical protein
LRIAGVLFATHSLHFRVHTRVLLTLLVACAVTMALWAEPPTRALFREAAEAQKAGQLEVELEKLEAVRTVRPDFPRLAADAAQPRRDDLALGWLHNGCCDVVGNSGWALFESPAATRAPREVAFFAVTP